MAEESRFSHIDAQTGGVRMVDVSRKPITDRCAVASAFVRVGAGAFGQLAAGVSRKGDALTTAQIAGIQAAKRTSELIPLCHGLAPDVIDVRCELTAPDGVTIRAEVRTQGRTGVEMEALTAAAVAALTIYDMCKAVSRGAEIGPLRLEAKSGGASGSWTRGG
jgi:cyclic pyranopterin monophosphate synthase